MNYFLIFLGVILSVGSFPFSFGYVSLDTSVYPVPDIDPLELWNLNDVIIDGTVIEKESLQDENGREFLETRYHVRVFSGSYDSHGTYDEWSIGNVHKETWYGACSCHEIDSDGWELAEDELKDDMNGKTGVGTIGRTWLGNNDEYQGEDNDGYAVDMQLT